MAALGPPARFRAARYVIPAALALALALAALFFRLPGIPTYDAAQVFTPCLVVTPGREHWGKPFCHGTSRVGARGAAMAFNSRGIRDREYAPRARRGVFRILVLGSSNTLGPGVAEPDTFPRQLERSLERAGRKVEVINAAMVGYCTLQTALHARELVDAYAPNLVLLQFVQGTCPLFDGAWAGRAREEDGLPVSLDRSLFGAAGPLSGLNGFAFRHPKLFFLGLTALDQIRKIRFSRSYARLADPQARLAAFLAPSLRYLAGLRAASAARGAGFAVFSYKMRPFMQSVPSQMSPWVARLLSPFIAAPGAGSAEILAAVRGAGFRVLYDDSPTEPYLVRGDAHLNEEGLRRLAASVASALLPTIPARQRAVRHN
jgi:hypothetical protein